MPLIKPVTRPQIDKTASACASVSVSVKMELIHPRKRASVSIILFIRDSSEWASERASSEIGAMTETDISLAAISLPAVLVFKLQWWHLDRVCLTEKKRKRTKTNGKKCTIITFDLPLHPPTRKSGVLILPSLRLRNWLINQRSRSTPHRGRTTVMQPMCGTPRVEEPSAKRFRFTTTTNFHCIRSRGSAIAVPRLDRDLSKFFTVRSSV